MTLPRVLSHPPVHDYVDRLDGHAATLVHRDEPWPRLPNLHDPAWVTAHADDWDLAHLHFSWEQYPPGVLRAVLAAHRCAGTPVVWTAHDLRNPHLHDAGAQDPYLEVLASEASAVVTLTRGAAAAVEERVGRHARVIPHGPIVPPAQAARLRRSPRADSPFRVLLLAKSLRANLDWRTPLAVSARWDPSDPPLELLVHLHPDAPDAERVVTAATAPSTRLTVAPRLSTPELWREVAAADALLLPYRWGTHSGLLELATDLGTPVVASDVGFLGEQAPCHLVSVGEDGVDPDDLHRVLLELAAGPRRRDAVSVAAREADLAMLRSAHAELYAGLVASGPLPGRAVSR